MAVTNQKLQVLEQMSIFKFKREELPKGSLMWLLIFEIDNGTEL